jgi:hypothetical protein
MASSPRFPCSGFGDSRIRVIEANSPDEFKALSDLDKADLIACPFLQTLKNIDPTMELARSAGLPGLVKGVTYGFDMLAFTPDLKYYVQVCSTRVTGNKIKFRHGANEVKFERSQCWEYCVKRQIIEVIIIRTRENPENIPFELLRADDPKCPICLDDLSGNVLNCPNNHQVCFHCFQLLPRQGGVCKCPTCRSNYTIFTYDKFKRMEGIVTERPGHFSFNLSGGNSFKTYAYNEALFLGMLKVCYNSHFMEIEERMLISSFYNWYAIHNDKFSLYDFNMTDYSVEAQRVIKDITNSEAITTFIEEIHHPDIYKDVVDTHFYLQGYDDNKFYADLEVIDGHINRIKDYPNNSKEQLKKEIFFRTLINKYDRDTLIDKFNKILLKIMNYSSNTNNNLLKRRIVEV